MYVCVFDSGLSSDLIDCCSKTQLLWFNIQAHESSFSFSFPLGNILALLWRPCPYVVTSLQKPPLCVTCQQTFPSYPQLKASSCPVLPPQKIQCFCFHRTNTGCSHLATPPGNMLLPVWNLFQFLVETIVGESCSDVSTHLEELSTSGGSPAAVRCMMYTHEESFPGHWRG